MKRILLAAACAAVLSAAAQAGDPVAAGFGNTVTQTMADGSKVVIYVNPDKTWEQHRGAAVFKGTYTVNGSNVCFTLTDPAPADPSKATNCSEIKGDHKVGDTWTETTPDGKTITMAITAGR